MASSPPPPSNDSVMSDLNSNGSRKRMSTERVDDSSASSWKRQKQDDKRSELKAYARASIDILDSLCQALPPLSISDTHFLLSPGWSEAIDSFLEAAISSFQSLKLGARSHFQHWKELKSQAEEAAQRVGMGASLGDGWVALIGRMTLGHDLDNFKRLVENLRLFAFLCAKYQHD